MDLIIYHNNCPDGWCAAYIAKKKYPKAELLPLNHGLSTEQLDDLFIKAERKDVLVVDYSLRTRELNDHLNTIAKSFRILDHHKTAKAALEGADYATFDMARSGAGLAWDYLFGTDSDLYTDFDRHNSPNFPPNRPWWVDYTEDQDLWNWKLENSQTINAFLMVQPRDVETWDKLTQLSAQEAGNYGVGVREYIEYYTRSVLAETQPGVLQFGVPPLALELGIDPIRCGVLNIPYVGVSEAGNAVCKNGYPVAVCWFERGDGVVQFSLRSNKEDEGGGVDVSAIAKNFGGGGHKNAAGFQLQLQDGRDLVDRILCRPTYRAKLAEAVAQIDQETLGKVARDMLRDGILDT